VASAVAVGLFIGCLPLYGLHFVLCSLVCLPLGLDLVLAYLVANISNPLLAPFLVTLEIEVGSLLTSGRHAAFTLARARQTGFIGFVFEAAVGSVFVGGVLAALGSGVAYVLTARRATTSLTPLQDDDQQLAAIRRTLARYAPAARADRWSVTGKLHWDPLTKLLFGLPHQLGRVLDAGAGRGQFGLLLLDLGRCESLTGYDADQHKVAVAAAAARGAAHFEVRDLLEVPLADFDTVLLFDVLHYLPLAEQDQLLTLVANRLGSGRLLIREVDGVPSARSTFTRLGEWLASRLGVHRGRGRRHYRPVSELVRRLHELGFECELRGASEGTPFANVFVLATRARASLALSPSSAEATASAPCA